MLVAEQLGAVEAPARKAAQPQAVADREDRLGELHHYFLGLIGGGVAHGGRAVDLLADLVGQPQDIQGGCISISSLGGIGGTAFTPIINAPEVAILGVSRSRMQPVWDGQEFKPRLMLPMSLSYDHRVIDGAAAARFVRFLGTRLEDLRRLTL